MLAGFPEQLLYSVRFKHESSGGEGVEERESGRGRMETRDVIEKSRGILWKIMKHHHDKCRPKSGLAAFLLSSLYQC